MGGCGHLSDAFPAFTEMTGWSLLSCAFSLLIKGTNVICNPGCWEPNKDLVQARVRKGPFQEIKFVFYFSYLFVVLGIKSRTSSVLGKRSVTELHIQFKEVRFKLRLKEKKERAKIALA
jgi:hypothetical protein